MDPFLEPAEVQALTARVRARLGALEPEEKRMFGGTTFMLAGHMLCCVSKRGLMARVGAAAEPAALARPHARPCEGTGRPMPGFVMVAAAGLPDEQVLDAWLTLARDYIVTLPPKRAVRA